MATGKRYYWMKLKESFMTSDTIDFFMSQPDGANYVVLYQMLCLKTINTDGRLSRQIGEIIIQYDCEKIQRDCKWFSIDTIRVALELYRKVGLIYEDVDGTLVLTDHEGLVGYESDWSSKKKRQRAAPSQDKVGTLLGTMSPPMFPECPPNVPQNVPTNVPIDIEIDIRDRDKRLDIREKKKKEKKADAFVVFAADNTALLDTLLDFEKMRKSIKKPMTDRAKQMLVNKLQRDFSPDLWIPVLEQSIKFCWQDVYPLKDQQSLSQNCSAADQLKALYDMFATDEDSG